MSVNYEGIYICYEKSTRFPNTAWSFGFCRLDSMIVGAPVNLQRVVLTSRNDKYYWRKHKKPVRKVLVSIDERPSGNSSGRVYVRKAG